MKNVTQAAYTTVHIAMRHSTNISGRISSSEPLLSHKAFDKMMTNLQ